jgi:general secretion pathway protein C
MQLVDRIVAPLRRPSGGVQGLAAAAPTIAAVVLAIVIAAQLASLVWRALGAGDGELESGAVDFAPEAPAVDLPAIVNAHLFGVAADSGDPSSAPATSANLALTGTLAGREPEQGWAIIGASGQSARVYATGAALPGGTKLVAVYPDRVILDRNGSRESLMLPRLSGGAGSATAPRVAGRQPSASPDASLADSVRQLLVQNPQAGGDLLRPQPVFAGGSLRGYRVYPGRNRAQFAGLGLQPGDLVMAVNGAALDDPNRGLEILRGVGQGSAVTLTVERGGQQQQIAIDPVTAVQELQQAPAEEEPVEEEPVAEDDAEELEMVEEEEPATE